MVKRQQKTGQYKDTTGVAFLNQSPSTETENNQNINCNLNMNKKLIRLTESDVHRIVKESIGKVLRETEYYDPADFEIPTKKRDTYYLCFYPGAYGNNPRYIWRTAPKEVGFSDAEKMKVSQEFRNLEDAVQYAREESNRWLNSVRSAEEFLRAENERLSRRTQS